MADAPGGWPASRRPPRTESLMPPIGVQPPGGPSCPKCGVWEMDTSPAPRGSLPPLAPGPPICDGRIIIIIVAPDASTSGDCRPMEGPRDDMLIMAALPVGIPGGDGAGYACAPGKPDGACEAAIREEAPAGPAAIVVGGGWRCGTAPGW
jgi:hypothetical protein